MSFSHTLLVASWPQESTPPVEATSTPPTDVSSAAAGTGDGGETTPPPPLSKSQLKKLAKGKVHTLVHPTLSGNPCLRTFSVSMHFPSCVGLSYKQKLLCSCCLPPTHSSIFFLFRFALLFTFKTGKGKERKATMESTVVVGGNNDCGGCRGRWDFQTRQETSPIQTNGIQK